MSFHSYPAPDEEEDLYEKRASPAGCLLVIILIACAVVCLIYLAVQSIMNLFL